jgi:alkyl sulfatase BDS1-like metallo-beta-lactamase superfamily hydrolase
MTKQKVKIFVDRSWSAVEKEVNEFLEEKRNYVGFVHDVKLTTVARPVRGGNRPETSVEFVATVLYTKELNEND